MFISQPGMIALRRLRVLSFQGAEFAHAETLTSVRAASRVAQVCAARVKDRPRAQDEEDAAAQARWKAPDPAKRSLRVVLERVAPRFSHTLDPVVLIIVPTTQLDAQARYQIRMTMLLRSMRLIKF